MNMIFIAEMVKNENKKFNLIGKYTPLANT